MVDVRCNFQHTYKPDDLDEFHKLRMGRMVMVNMGFVVLMVFFQRLELNGTIQMGFLFLLANTNKLDCDE